MSVANPYSHLLKLYKIIIAQILRADIPRKLLKSDLSRGSCVFCDATSGLHSLHATHNHEGQQENYSSMLLMCYNIQVVGFASENESEICESCTGRLRDALSFRLQVEAIDESLRAESSNIGYIIQNIKQKRRQSNSKETINFSTNHSLPTLEYNIDENGTIESQQSDDDFDDKDFDYSDIFEGGYPNVEPKVDSIKNLDYDFSQKLREQYDIAKLERDKQKQNTQNINIPPLNPLSRTCPVCGNNFFLHKDLVPHYASHFTKYLCEICGQSFLKRQSLLKHRRLHDGIMYPCNLCNKVFRIDSALKRHVQRVHEKSANDKRLCCICNKEFPTYYARSEHLYLVHKIERPIYRCEPCNRVFPRAGRLTEHVRKFHRKTKTHECQYCDSKFFERALLKSHMLKHTGEKKFCCNTCGKSYGRRYTIIQHLKIHNNVRAHKCNVCGQAFIQKCTLKGHMKIHQR